MCQAYRAKKQRKKLGWYSFILTLISILDFEGKYFSSWDTSISIQLENFLFGLICDVDSNQKAPWITCSLNSLVIQWERNYNKTEGRAGTLLGLQIRLHTPWSKRNSSHLWGQEGEHQEVGALWIMSLGITLDTHPEDVSLELSALEWRGMLAGQEACQRRWECSYIAVLLHH